MEILNNNISDLSLNKASIEIVQSKSQSFDNSKKVQSAKDFEAMFVHKLLDSMRNTVDMEGIFDDPVGEQINSMFYSFLADDLSDKGGLGMWKDIYKMMDNDNPGVLDETI